MKNCQNRSRLVLPTRVQDTRWRRGHVRHQLEFELFKLTVNVAHETGAVTMDQKVFIAEWSMMRLPWTNRVKTLAHELTHVIQSSLSIGRSDLTHRWLGEGFAEWVSFKVVDALEAKDFF
jgi:hypothetical protein